MYTRVHNSHKFRPSPEKIESRQPNRHEAFHLVDIFDVTLVVPAPYERSLPSGYQHCLLKELNLWYMYCGQKQFFLNKLKYTSMSSSK